MARCRVERSGIAAAPPPKNRTCESPRIRLKPPPLCHLCGTEDPFLDGLYSSLRYSPLHSGPRHRLPSFGLFGFHRLTSPSVPTSSLIASAETCRKSAPFRTGYAHPAAALSAPLQGSLRLLRLSFTPSVITRPCGRVSVSRRNGWGLPCCMKGRNDRVGCVLFVRRGLMSPSPTT